MISSSRHLADLDRYLARHGFAPHPVHGTWLDRSTGQQTLRVLHEPGEATLMYCLDAHSVCLYEAVFSPGTPYTGSSPRSTPRSARPRPRPARDGPDTPPVSGAQSTKVVTPDDDQ